MSQEFLSLFFLVYGIKGLYYERLLLATYFMRGSWLLVLSVGNLHVAYTSNVGAVDSLM